MKNCFLFAAIFVLMTLGSCKNDNGTVVALRLDQTELELVKGSEHHLVAYTVPADEDAVFEWFSSMPEYVSVSSEGVVKAEKLYYRNETDTEATPVSVFCRSGNGAAECKVTVLPLDMERMELKAEATSSGALVLNPGEEKVVEVVFYPEDADIDPDAIEWTTSAWEYAELVREKTSGRKAVVLAKWPGSATIKAAYKQISASVNLVVRPVNAQSVSISGPETVRVVEGSTIQFKASVVPQNATVECQWNSDDTSVASVDTDSGLVTALAPGTARIKVVAGMVEDHVVVNVVPSE